MEILWLLLFVFVSDRSNDWLSGILHLIEFFVLFFFFQINDCDVLIVFFFKRKQMIPNCPIVSCSYKSNKQALLYLISSAE